MSEQPHVENQLSDYIDGLLTDSQQDAVNRHLHSCHTCRQALLELQMTLAFARSLPTATPPETLRTDVLQRLQAEAEQAARQAARPPQTGRLRPFIRRSPWRYAAVAVVLLMLVGVGGLAVNFGSLNALMGIGRQSVSVFDTAVEMDNSGAVSEQAAPSAPIDERSIEIGQRTIIQRGSLTVDVVDVETQFERVSHFVQDKGGFVESSSLGDDLRFDQRRPEPVKRRIARLDLRVPSEKLQPLIDQVCDIGDACTYQTHGDDVTEQYVDTAAQLRTFTAQEARLLEILESAKTVDEVLRVEQELWRIRGQVERMQGQLRYWDRASALSSLSVTLQQPAPLGYGNFGTDLGSRLLARLYQAGDLLIRSVEFMMLGLATVIPWLALIAVGWWGIRKWR